MKWIYKEKSKEFTYEQNLLEEGAMNMTPTFHFCFSKKTHPYSSLYITVSICHIVIKIPTFEPCRQTNSALWEKPWLWAWVVVWGQKSKPLTMAVMGEEYMRLPMTTQIEPTTVARFSGSTLSITQISTMMKNTNTTKNKANTFLCKSHTFPKCQ